MQNAWSLIEEKLNGWWVYSVRMLPNFVLAIVLLAVFWLIARMVRNIAYRFILRVSKSISVSSLLSGVIYILILISGVMTALDILELDKTVASLLAGVGIIGLALGFAFQDLTSNFISGAFIALKRPFDVGHIVETNGFTGTIEEIRLRSTTLKTSAGLHVIIPNKDIFQKPIINYSRTDARRVELDFAIPNSIDAPFAERIIRTAIVTLGGTNGVRDFEFYYTAIESPNMRIHVTFWTQRIDPASFLQVRHEAILAIFSSFRENGIYEIKVDGPPKSNLPDGNQKG